ncbi:threonine--tRNA ligase [Halobacillus litoralis]|uniref:threonine--tRNA ligase n=1 Tax=Halobacillus litoralis TaxID=45668 RepID=UPI001CFF2E44|nr:threonine--tRNA ligase [Halobacillus litoralis]
MSEKDIVVSFPDGNKKSYRKGVTLEEIAQSISPSLKKRSVVGEVNGELYDYRRPIHDDAAIALHDLSSKEGVQVMRHTAAHIMAQAVRRIYGNVHLGAGPVIENGFYYDIDGAESMSVDDLPAIENEMKRIVSENLKVEREAVSRKEAEHLFAKDPLKLALLEKIPEGEEITVYRQGEFIDLCRGPHLPSTQHLKAFSLTNVSGAYWLGDQKNKMLQRIYGVAFSSEKELKDYFYFREEAKKRDHRKLGSEMDLFMFSDEAPGMPFYLSNGQIMRNELQSFLRKLQGSFHYEEVQTPMMMNERLWKQSGHWDHYKENMYFSEVDDQPFALKPMNCPGHMLIYKNKRRSYRDLPIRMAEFGHVHRHEFSGALNGLLRVRAFCQDDAHIFAAPNQIEEEIMSALKLMDDVYQTFGFSYEVELSTRPEDYMGETSLWDLAEGALKNVLENMNYNYKVNEGDGAFYGPKIDIHIKDALKRSHQCATVQLDFQLPEKFDLSYIDEQNEKVRPVVIHRAVFGSIDRFLGILIEHFAGAFPAWLAPEQVKILPVSSNVHEPYAAQIADRLVEKGFRVDLDARNEKLGYRIREAQMSKAPFILIIGDQEMADGSVQVRKYGRQESVKMNIEDFLVMMTQVVEKKELR